MFMIAGPNGSGKSTLYETRIAPKIAAPFINADHIRRDELNDPRPEAAYEAARIAEQRRRELLSQGRSFITESVFSHPSKLTLVDDAKKAGFRVVLYHVGIDSPDLSVARVTERVKEGGHDVPEDKIRARYERNAALIRKAVLRADSAHVFDNSALNRPPVRILSLSHGRIVFKAEKIPRWAQRVYAEELKA